MALRPSAAANGADKQGSTAMSPGSLQAPNRVRRLRLTTSSGQEKQKQLLASDTGHFSMIK